MTWFQIAECRSTCLSISRDHNQLAITRFVLDDAPWNAMMQWSHLMYKHNESELNWIAKASQYRLLVVIMCCAAVSSSCHRSTPKTNLRHQHHSVRSNVLHTRRDTEVRARDSGAHYIWLTLIWLEILQTLCIHARDVTDSDTSEHARGWQIKSLCSSSICGPVAQTAMLNSIGAGRYYIA